jgi:hypothetical protein
MRFDATLTCRNYTVRGEASMNVQAPFREAYDAGGVTLPSWTMRYARPMRDVVTWRQLVLPVIVSIVGLLLALAPQGAVR